MRPSEATHFTGEASATLARPRYLENGRVRNVEKGLDSLGRGHENREDRPFFLSLPEVMRCPRYLLSMILNWIADLRLGYLKILTTQSLSRKMV